MPGQEPNSQTAVFYVDTGYRKEYNLVIKVRKVIHIKQINKSRTKGGYDNEQNRIF